MSRRAYLLVSTVIFSIVALFHLAKILFGWSVIIGGWSVPMWLSWVGIIMGAPWPASDSALPDGHHAQALSVEMNWTE